MSKVFNYKTGPKKEKKFSKMTLSIQSILYSLTFPAVPKGPQVN